LIVKINVLGAAGEVGRSGFLVNCDGTNLLLDYGVMFAKKRTDPPIYPLHVKSKDVDATIRLCLMEGIPVFTVHLQPLI